MFARTRWRIATWNSDIVGGTLVIGFGGGTVEIGLQHGGESHTLHCAGVSGSVGLGISTRNVSLPSSQLGFDPQIRTQGGTLYKNELAIRGALTLEDLQSSWILVQGLELQILDEGQAGYLVIFGSGTATLSTFLGGGGLPSLCLAVATCRAATFLSTGQAGLPNLAYTGYRFTVTGTT